MVDVGGGGYEELQGNWEVGSIQAVRKEYFATRQIEREIRLHKTDNAYGFATADFTRSERLDKCKTGTRQADDNGAGNEGKAHGLHVYGKPCIREAWWITP